jgi:hypothetical protein
MEVLDAEMRAAATLDLDAQYLLLENFQLGLNTWTGRDTFDCR